MLSVKPSIVALTQGRNQPSTRFRWSQYVDYIRQGGFDVNELESYFGAYAPEHFFQRPAWLAGAIAENVVRVMRSKQFSLRFLQRNLTATLCTLEPLLKSPFVFDVDDAIFLGQRGESANRIARSASIIICGNDFLADHFNKYGKVVVLPTAVDATRFVPRVVHSLTQQVIGWSGSSSGFKYLYAIEPALRVLLNRYPSVLFKVISNSRPIFKTLPLNQVVFELWKPEREAGVLQEFTVGIMPLEDDLWARGKCSFKMLTYMSTGLPVVVSPVGMNLEILDQGPCGFAAKTSDDWVDAISLLLSNTTLACQMGMSGRQIIEARYSRNVIAPKLTQLLMEQI